MVFQCILFATDEQGRQSAESAESESAIFHQRRIHEKLRMQETFAKSRESVARPPRWGMIAWAAAMVANQCFISMTWRRGEGD